MNKEKSKNIKKPSENSFSKSFDIFYTKKILPNLSKIEKERQKYMMILAAIIVIGIAICVAVSIILSSFIISLYIAAIIIATIVLKLVEKLYNDKAKKVVLPNILSFIGTFEINTSEKTLKDYVDDLHLFNNFNFYVYDDRLKGKYKDLEIEIEEISLEKEQINNKNKRNREIIKQKSPIAISAKTKIIYTLVRNIAVMIKEQQPVIQIPNKIFSGLFIRVPSLKQYKGRTVIKAENSSHNHKGENKVNLEDPIFEKLYDTFSTDQIEARYLITTAFMNRMVMLAQKGIGSKIFVSFENGYVNIAVSMKKDWLKLPIIKPVTDIQNYKNIVAELYSILKIIDSLKLDQNIGL